MLPFTMSFKYEYNSAVRGYQVYKPVWKPEVDQVLHAKRELDNFADMFAEAFSSRRDGRPSWKSIRELRGSSLDIVITDYAN